MDIIYPAKANKYGPNDTYYLAEKEKEKRDVSLMLNFPINI